MTWHNLEAVTGTYPAQLATPLWNCTCDHCKQISLWLHTKSREGIQILPSATNAPMAHDDLPDDCKSDFEEAREISGQSPRGAAALLRLALQKLCVHLGGLGKNINDDIKSLVSGGLAPQVQQALDVVRVTGNNAVHPGEISLEENPEHVTVMFEMINLIVEELISRPKQIAERFQSLPIGALEAIARRDVPKLLANGGGD